MVYPYRCPTCRKPGELVTSYENRENGLKNTTCECGTTGMIRTYTSVGVQFKGPGFYHTDHKMVDDVRKSRSTN